MGELLCTLKASGVREWCVLRLGYYAVLRPEEAVDLRRENLVSLPDPSLLARRPYDLRHAAVSTWLNAGVAPLQIAEWAGHRVDVPLRVYAKWADRGGDIDSVTVLP